MDPAGKIASQDWMTAAETKAVIAALTRKGAIVRFVGGCVRDAILGRKVKDIDIATHDPPETVIKLLEAARIKAVPTGIEHGTVTAVVDRAHFEITTLREDVETYGRHAKVAFTDDWKADAARRDFTFNAIFCGPDGTLYDPFGGIADLHAGRVRFVGDPETRIKEDVLRLLRFFRFHAHYGKGDPDQAALSACRKLAHFLPTLSGERVAGEILRLLSAADPASVFDLMQTDGVLSHVLPEAEHIRKLAVLAAIENELGENDPLLRLASVLRPDSGIAQAVAERLRLSRAERERLAALVAPEIPVTVTGEEKIHRRELYCLGAARYRDLAFLAWADSPAANDSRFQAMLASMQDWKPKELPIKGRDVLALGVENGPKVGNFLRTVEEWWIDNDFTPDRAACLEKLRKLAAH